MKRLQRNLAMALSLFLLLTLALIVGLVIQQKRSLTELQAAAGENKSALYQRYARAGQIISRDDVVLADSTSGERRYNGDQNLAEALLPVVGDYTHNMTNTVESRMQAPLLGPRSNLLRQFLLDIQGKGHLPDTVGLTVHAELSRFIYNEMGGRPGGVVVLNYQTGALLAVVSSPSTSPYNVVNWENIPDTALFNRALNGQYAPGSTFKTIVASAWLSDPAFDADRVVVCLGSEPVVPYGAFENTGREAHGPVQLEEGFAVSCNAFFGTLGLQLGRSALVSEAELFGFNRSLNLTPLLASESRIDLVANDEPNLSWAAIGQPIGDSVMTVSPLHLALIGGAVANQGVMQTPYLVDHLEDPLGVHYEEAQSSPLLALPTQSNRELYALMRAAVNQGTGQPAALEGHAIGGKTGTAEASDEAGEETVYSLFLGFDATEGYPYAVGIVLEARDYPAVTLARAIFGRLSTMSP